ncbi:hypothetical protein SprV_0100210800 [Sparganum proliferum]
MARCKVDIVALSETRFSEQGQLEVGVRYTLFWSSRSRAERLDTGVAFRISNNIVGRLPCLPQSINDCLMSLRLPLRNQLKLRLEDMPVADVNAFVETQWCQLQDAVHSTALDVFGRATRQHQGWLDDNDAVNNNLLAEKNRLHRAYLDRPTDVNKAIFGQCRRLAQQRLRKMKDA